MIAGLRHRLVHDYDGTNWNIIVDVIFEELPIFIEQIIREVKSRLRKRIPVRSRIIEIPKGNGKTKNLTVINYFDRIAQQAVSIVMVLEKE